MAQTDYVSRGQKRKKKAPKKPPTPWLRIFVSLALVCAFVFGLYALKSSPESEPDAREVEQIQEGANNTSSQNQADVVTSGALDKEPLPVLGEEEWAFIDALPEYSVQVDVPEREQSDRKYIMQCGSFRTTDRAQELRAKLAFNGLEAEVLQSDGQNGRWYRVVLGPYDNKRAAERDRHQVRRDNINNCKIY